MKISIKLIILLITILLFSFTSLKNCYAVGQMFADADDFLGMGENVEDVISTEKLKETSDFMYKAFFAVAIVVALIVGVVIGVKYIYESAEGQAKLKEAFIPYVVGCLIVFSAFPIWKMVINFGNEQGFVKETISENEAFVIYNEIATKYSNQGRSVLNNASEHEIKGAWQYVSQNYYPEMDICQIIYENRNTFPGYLGVEYVSRFGNIDKIWEAFFDKYYTQGAGDISAWVDGIGGAVELLYSLYQLK